MPSYIIILALFVSGVYVKLRKLSSQNVLKMSFWLIVSYSFLLLTHVFAGISYKSGSAIRILPYFILCLLLMLIGEKLGRKIKMKSVTKRIKLKISKLAFLSVVGAFFFIFDLLRLNSISFGTRIEDFQISTIGVIGNILSSIGIIVWLMSLYENRIHNIKIPFLSYLAVLAYVSGGVLSAGRQAIILILLSSVILILFSNKRKKELNQLLENNLKIKRKFPWGFIIIFSLFTGYFFFISSVRSQINDINNKMKMLETVFNADISNETIEDVYKLDPLSDIYIESLFYYSHELNRLDLLYQFYDYHPIFGLSQVSYIERRLQWIFGKQNEISWSEVELAIEQKGEFYSHSWGTIITNFIIDFGRFGALMACFILGFIIGIFYRNLLQRETPVKVVQHCLLLAGVVFSIQFSPFSELIWAFPLVLTSFINFETQNIDLTIKQTKNLTE